MITMHANCLVNSYVWIPRVDRYLFTFKSKVKSRVKSVAGEEDSNLLRVYARGHEAEPCQFQVTGGAGGWSLDAHRAPPRGFCGCGGMLGHPGSRKGLKTALFVSGISDTSQSVRFAAIFFACQFSVPPERPGDAGRAFVASDRAPTKSRVVSPLSGFNP